MVPPGGPTPPPPPTQVQDLPWSEDVRAQWTDEISRADRLRDTIAETFDWQGNLERYKPQPHRDDVNVMADFRDVERKKAALFYDLPTIALAAFPSTPPEVGSALLLHQRALNALLAATPAEGGVGAKATVDRALFDVLCPAGVGIARIGYGVTTVPVYVDPATGQPSPDPIEGVEPVPVPIHERLFFTTESPWALLLPASLRTNDIDAGPWVGYRWKRPVSQVRAEFNKPEDWMPGSASADPYAPDDALGQAGRGRHTQGHDPEVTGVTIYFKASLFPSTGVQHPELIGVLELAEGDPDTPLRYALLPWQTLDPQTGQLTADSFRGFPIDPLIIRDVTDSPWGFSDCAVTAALTIEENRGRTTQQEVRKANRVIMLYDPAELPEDEREAVKNGSVGTFVPVNAGALRSAGGAQGIMQQASQLSMARANLEWAAEVVRNRELALGIGANQQGMQSARKQTATESSLLQRNTDARFEQERQRVLRWYLRCVRKLDALAHRYGGAVVPQVLGPVAGQQWAQMHQQVLGWHTYTVQMDSGKYVDIESNRKQKLDLLNLIGKAPTVNPAPIIADIVRDFGYDPQTVIVQPSPPKPEPPKVTLSISADQFDPGLPQFPILLEMARQGGFQISDTAVQMAQAAAAQRAQAAALGGMKPEAAGDLPTMPVPPPAPAQAPPAAAGPAPGPGAPQIQGPMPPMGTIDQRSANQTGQLPGPGPRV